MHPAEAFRVTDEAKLLNHLERHPFVTIAAAPEGRLLVAHAPALMRRTLDSLALDFHLSRGNALAPYLAGSFAGLAVSLGAEAYVSPDWYVSVDQVPTWNYASVEVEGRVTALDAQDLVFLLDDLSARQETQLAPKPAWTRAKMSPGRFDKMMTMIVGARLTVDRFEGVFKLSQNKSDGDRAGVITALGDHPMAHLMRGEEGA